MDFSQLFNVDFGRASREMADQEFEQFVKRTIEGNPETLRNLIGNGQIRQFVAWLMSVTTPAMRSVVGNVVAELITHHKALPVMFRHPLGSFIRGFSQAAAPVLNNQGTTLADINACMDQSWQHSSERTALEAGDQVCTGPHRQHNLHRVSVNCGAPAEHRADTMSYREMIENYRFKAFCPDCFPGATVGRITVPIAKNPVIQNFINACPMNKRGSFAFLFWWLLNFKMHDAAIPAPAGGVAPQRIPGATPTSGDGFAWWGLAALTRMARDNPKGLVKILPNGTIEEHVRNPGQLIGVVLPQILAAYDPTNLQKGMDFLDNMFDMPAIQARVRAAVASADIEGRVTNAFNWAWSWGRWGLIRGVTMGVTAYALLGVISVTILVISGYTFLSNLVEIVLHAPHYEYWSNLREAKVLERVLYIREGLMPDGSIVFARDLVESMLYGALGLFLFRFIVPLYDRVHAAIGRAARSLNPLSGGGATNGFGAMIAEELRSRGWLTGAVIEHTERMASIADVNHRRAILGRPPLAHGTLLKTGITITIIATLGVVIVMIGYIDTYGWSASSGVIILFAGIGCIAEFAKLVSVKVSFDFFTKMGESMLTRTSIGIVVAFLFFTALVTGGQISDWWKRGAPDRETRVEAREQKVEKKTSAKKKASDKPAYCAHYTPADNMPGCQ